jgi:hypothetical protein
MVRLSWLLAAIVLTVGSYWQGQSKLAFAALGCLAVFHIITAIKDRTP